MYNKKKRNNSYLKYPKYNNLYLRYRNFQRKPRLKPGIAYLLSFLVIFGALFFAFLIFVCLHEGFGGKIIDTSRKS